MTEEKLKRVTVASVAGGILLLVILVSILIWQLVAISLEKNKKQELLDKIAYYDTVKNDKEKVLEAVSSKWWIEQRARELGYRYIDDKLC